MNFHIFFSTGIYHSLVSYAKIIISLYLREKWGKKRPQPVLVTVLFYFTKIALLLVQFFVDKFVPTTIFFVVFVLIFPELFLV